MPIRPDLRHLYRTPEYKAQRARVVERSGNKCEQCQVPNGEVIGRFRKYSGWWFTLFGQAHDNTGEFQFMFHGSDPRFDCPDSVVEVVLTMAHLDHNPANNSDENTKFLCQWCHLHYDQLHHNETRAERKDRNRPLLAS